jgi:hypothetical protein
MEPMTAEQLAMLADDIADMAQEFIDANDAKSLRTMATNLAQMIRRHVPATPTDETQRPFPSVGEIEFPIPRQR